MKIGQLTSVIRSDMRRYADNGGWFQSSGFWITAIYRFGAWAKCVRFRPFRMVLRLLHFLLATPFRLVCHVYLPSGANIGPGLLLPHPYLILLSGGSRVGADCTIYHDVTLGMGSVPGAPCLSNNVVVFPGARILGGVSIGSHAHIGANSVVTRDIQADAVVVSPMARTMARGAFGRH